MKIALLAGRDPKILTDTDGGSVYLEYLSQFLSQQGYAVDIFIPLGVAGGSYSQTRSKYQMEIIQESNEGARIATHYFPTSQSDDAFQAASAESDYFLNRIARSQSFVEFFQDRKLFSYDAVFVLHIANAFALTKHELLPFDRTVLFPMMTSTHYEYFSDVPEIYVHHEKQTFDRIEHICSPSDDEIASIVKRFGVNEAKIFKVHRGFEQFDFPVFNRKNPDLSDLRIFSANGIRPQKAHLFFVDVVEQLLNFGAQPKVVFTGNNGKSHNATYNNYTKNFWDRVQKKGLTKYFECHDVITRSAMVNLMRESTVALYPSISETFGKSALESVVSGLPTFVLDDVPAFREFIFPNTTGIICPRDELQCAEAIIKLCNSPLQYQSISKNGTLLRSTFAWETVLSILIKELKDRGVLS